MIRLKDFSFYLGTKRILNNLNIEILDNTKVLLIGENGSGKSTLLRVLSKSYPRALFLDTFKTSFYLSDSFYLPGHYYARSYLIKMSGVFNQTKDIDYLMQEFQLENKKIKALSKGNRQKLGIILGLVSGAEVIYYDEALDGLDNDSIKVFIRLLGDFSKTAVIVTHYPELFKGYPFIKYHLKGGSLLEN